MANNVLNLTGMDKPDFVTWDTIKYLTLMGSHAYGNATFNSDFDFYGFLIPPADVLFPHLRGEIPEFGRHKEKFLQFQIHGYEEPTWGEIDLYLYTLPRYFQLVMEGNPNMIDSLFTPADCVKYTTPISRLVHDNRKLFLSQKCYHTFRGMAFSHWSRITNRTREGSRAELVEKYGYDVKDASHMVRCLLEVKQVLFEGDLDLTRNATLLTEVKSGGWSLEDVRKFFMTEMDILDMAVYGEGEKLAVRYAPDEDAIYNLLCDCLEMEYGSLKDLGMAFPRVYEKILGKETM
jgi:uncharacterized protein